MGDSARAQNILDATNDPCTHLLDTLDDNGEALPKLLIALVISIRSLEEVSTVNNDHALDARYVVRGGCGYCLGAKGSFLGALSNG